jgi:hypothetical protein
MKQRSLRAALAVGVAGLVASGLSAVPANAATVIQVRPADLLAPQGVTGGATMDFLAEGIHLKVPNAADAARARFKVGLPLSSVHTVEYQWFGTANKPAILYDIDITGDGKADGELVGELFYGGTDVWLNDNATFPNTTFAPLSPCGPPFGSTPQNGNQDGCVPPGGGGGAGANEHGTLNDWYRSLSAGGKTPVIVQGGFFAGGLVQDGVLRSETYGPNQYVFTNLPKAAVTVTAKAKGGPFKTGSKIKVKGTAKPVGPNATVQLQVKKNGKWKTKAEKPLAANGAYELKTKAGKPGKVRLRVLVTETSSTAAGKSGKVEVTVK